MLLFLSHNKLLINDKINCFVINACIFLFLTMIQMVCLFCLHIFGLDNNISDLFIVVSELQYNVLCKYNILYLQFY
jgi:hypothetical protein